MHAATYACAALMYGALLVALGGMALAPMARRGAPS